MKREPLNETIDYTAEQSENFLKINGPDCESLRIDRFGMILNLIDFSTRNSSTMYWAIRSRMKIMMNYPFERSYSSNEIISSFPQIITVVNLWHHLGLLNWFFDSLSLNFSLNYSKGIFVSSSRLQLVVVFSFFSSFFNRIFDQCCQSLYRRYNHEIRKCALRNQDLGWKLNFDNNNVTDSIFHVQYDAMNRQLISCFLMSLYPFKHRDHEWMKLQIRNSQNSLFHP